MTIARADIVTRVAERLQVVAEGCAVTSQDRLSIERAIDDAYNASRDECRLPWDLTDIPLASVAPLTIMAAALAAGPVNAPNKADAEAGYASGFDQLRTVNRIRPDNSEPVYVEHY